jgi:DNA polymerase epsilon subunit 1
MGAPRRQGQTYRRLGKNGQTSYGPRKPQTIEASSLRRTELTSQNEKIEATRLAHSIDESMGFARFESGRRRVGWLCNMKSTSIEDEKVPGGRAGVDFYFIGDDGDTFKATMEYDPYFLLCVKRGREAEVEEWCKRAFEGLVKGIKRVEKEDLQMPNHLLGYRRTLLQLTFANVPDLLAVRKVLSPIAEKSKKNVNEMETYAEVARYELLLLLYGLHEANVGSANAGFDLFDDDQLDYEKRPNGFVDASDFIVDIREYDVPYHVRVVIDKGRSCSRRR